MPRIYCPLPLSEHAAVDLPERAVKHVQVLRFQPGDPLIVFNGRGGEYTATIEEIKKKAAILAEGFKKREKIVEADYYETLLKKTF